MQQEHNRNIHIMLFIFLSYSYHILGGSCLGFPLKSFYVLRPRRNSSSSGGSLLGKDLLDAGRLAVPKLLSVLPTVAKHVRYYVNIPSPCTIVFL